MMMAQNEQAPETSSRVTIYDVAEKAGVGIATVSRVLNGTKPVSKEKRSQVRSAVDRLGYVPNRTAKTLAERNRNVLAVAVPAFVTPFYTELLRGVRHVLKGVDTEMLLKDLGSQAPLSELECFLQQGVVDGLLVIGTSPDEATADLLTTWRAPAVLVGARVEGLDSFYWDEVAGGRMATRHLIEQGHRCIGLIRTCKPIAAQEQRLRGYRMALAAAGIAYDERLVCSGQTEKHAGFSEEAGYEAMQHLLAHHVPPVTAVFCSSDVQAVGAWKAIRDAGLSAPHDVALVGYSDVRVSRFIGLSSISHHMRSVGEQAARRLLHRMRSATPSFKPSGPVEMQIDPVMHVRRSSRLN